METIPPNLFRVQQAALTARLSHAFSSLRRAEGMNIFIPFLPGVNHVQKVNPDFRCVFRSLILLLFLCVFCTMAVLSPHALDSTSDWLDDHSIHHHHLIEFDEEVLVFSFFTAIAAGTVLPQTGTPRYPICSIYPAPLLPPPKSF